MALVFPVAQVCAQVDSTTVDSAGFRPERRTVVSEEGSDIQGDAASTETNTEGEVERPVSEATLAVELGGFIVDETQTKLGRDFYEIFYSAWVAPEGISEYTIVISEKPLPQRGTQVSVMVNDLLAFQGFLQPRLEAIEDDAEAARERALLYLRNYQDVVRSLQGDDMEGSGIF